MRRRTLLQTLAAGPALVALGGCSRETARPGPVVATASGRLRGQIVDPGDGGPPVHRFLGVPYAEPPFGANRFVAPRRRTPWTELRAADRHGEICPQTGGDLGGGDAVEGEDCLNLNIWTPELGAADLPVMVWAHGGGQVTGSGSSPLYEGTHFARDGVVLLTCNRRLGAEGYLYLERHFGDGIGPGNLGILDLVAVLEWVQENIASFGGDPNRVTLFGESGGAVAAQSAVATTTSKGLLHRVILQSGGFAAQRAETASELAAFAIDKLNVRAGDLDELRARPWRELVALYEEMNGLGLGQPQVYLPVLGETMPEHPVDAPAAGWGLDVDYLIGTCRDEANLFAMLTDLEQSPFHERACQLLRTADVPWATLRAAYASERPDADDEEIDKAIMGDAWFRVPSLRIADDHARYARARTFMYRFDWATQLLGAAHATDLIVFGNGVPLGIALGFANPDETARQMRRAWVRFAETGDPSTTAFAWPSYDTQIRKTISINDQMSLLEDPFAEQRACLRSLWSHGWAVAGL